MPFIAARSSFNIRSPSRLAQFADDVRVVRAPVLCDASLETFRRDAFDPGLPALFPHRHFIFPGTKPLPAASRWFQKSQTPGRSFVLNTEYLAPHGETRVPLEATYTTHGKDTFARTELPLSSFLQHMDRYGDVKARKPDHQIYLAQCPISTLPEALRKDLPTPLLVSKVGRGDVYDSSVWIGLAPTYSSLHKDPNPNLFVQLAGTKRIRIFEPGVGAELFAEAQKRVGGSASASLRGEEMMHGAEKEVLEQMVWRDLLLGEQGRVIGFDAVLGAGDGIFIPKGWWHSVVGVGKGVVASVNWWFR